MCAYETKPYRVVRQDGAIEIRDYTPYIVARVVTEGHRKEALEEGFRILAGYIFGKNKGQAKIAMTTPVQQASQKIDMTTPVTQQPGADGWVTEFMMPSRYTMATLPQPLDERIRFVMVPAMRMAVIRFSWWATTSRLQDHTRQLEKYLKENSIEIRSAPSYAFYNPPWTLPFLRRNEVMFEVGNK